MNTFLRTLDIYAYEIKMTLNQKETISTFLGKILSFLTYIILILFTWFVGNDFIYRVNPVSYVNEEIGTYHPRIDITPESFPLAFGLSDEFGTTVKNDSLIEYKLLKNQFLFNGTFKKTITEIDLERCKEKHFPTLTKIEFENANIDGFYCPKNYSEIFLEGSFISSNLTSLSFIAKKCDFQKYPQKCGTKQEINKFIAQKVLNYNLFFIENYISIGDYSNPLKPLVVNNWKFFQSNNLKITNFNVQENFLKTDIAFFSSQYNEKKFAKLVEEPTDWIDYNEKDGRLAMFNFHSSNISQQYYRKYIKISDILASVGGLIKISILFFTFIHKPFNNMERFNLLLKSFQEEEEILDFIERKKTFQLINPFNNVRGSFSSIKGDKILNENEDYTSNNILNRNMPQIKKNDFFAMKFKQFKEIQSMKKDNTNFNNSEVNFIRVRNKNFVNDLDKLEENSVNINDNWNNDLTTKQAILKNTKNEINLNSANDINNRSKTRLDNKSIITPKRINNNQSKQPAAEDSYPQNPKNLNNPINMQISIEKNENKLIIKNFKMGYCDLIMGYICNLKICKRNNLRSYKHSEYSKYERGFSSLIDYSNLVKIIIKIRLMIDKLLSKES